MPSCDIRIQLIQYPDHLDDHTTPLNDRQISITERGLEGVRLMLVYRPDKVWSLKEQEVFCHVERQRELLID